MAGPPRTPSLRVVITGGSAGIGRSMVECFADAGHRVLFTYLHSLESAEELCANYPLVEMSFLDQGDFASVLRFAEHVEQWAGDDGINILVNNAALGSATVERYIDNAIAARVTFPCNNNIVANCDTKKENTERRAQIRRAAADEALMRVNALGPLWVTDTLMPIVQKSVRGEAIIGRSYATIIFIGSVGGGSAAVFPEYRPSDLMGKAAMTYLAKHLAAEHVRGPVDVMCVSPGATETEMFRQSTLSKLDDVAAFVDGMPKRRLIQPTDIAESVLWLATSSAARVFHGAALDASLGLAVRPGLQTESNSQ